MSAFQKSMESRMSFAGCKIALLDRHDRVLVLLRDEKPDIPFPNTWDLPGGGRESSETPDQCVLRELREEFGIRLSVDRLLYKRRYPGHTTRDAFFFVGSITDSEIESIVFGEEGQRRDLMPIRKYLQSSRVVPRHQARMREHLESLRLDGDIDTDFVSVLETVGNRFRRGVDSGFDKPASGLSSARLSGMTQWRDDSERSDFNLAAGGSPNRDSSVECDDGSAPSQSHLGHR